MRRAACIAIFLCILAGCGDGMPNPAGDAVAAITVNASKFDADSTGTITGRVRWMGPAPEAVSIQVERFAADGVKTEHVVRPNPHALSIDENGGLAGAVVFLRGVNADEARPWDHPPVTVELNDEKPMVRQGDLPPGLVGFVHRGDVVTMVSRQPVLHSLRVRGAGFFTLTFPEPDKPRKRVLNETGLVELSSAAGFSAMHGFLFVDNHPYYTTTNAEGRFELPRVPPGQYDLVCWRPDPRVERMERDPETLLRVRLFFHPPKETIVPVTMHARETASIMMDVGP